MKSIVRHALMVIGLLLEATASADAGSRCIHQPRPIAAAAIDVEVSASRVTETSGAQRELETALVRMRDVRVGVAAARAQAGFAVSRYRDNGHSWVSFAPSWDTALADMPGFQGDVVIGLTWPDERFALDAGLSRATGAAYEFIVAVLANGPELLQSATFRADAGVQLDAAGTARVLQDLRDRLGFGAVQAGGQLPRPGMAPSGRLRGAQLGDWQAWNDPLFSGWSHVCEFPASGGNVFRVNIQPFVGGEVLLPGRPLSERLAEHLRRLSPIVEWALSARMHVILAFNNHVPWPPPERRWPDDGRSLWRDRSAQDELVDAWSSLAQTFRGRDGLLFELMNEPNNVANEGYAEMKSAWAQLQSRLVAAIRAVDPQRWVIVTPRWSAPNELFDFVLPTRERVIVDVHAYAPHGFTNQNPPGSVTYPGFAVDVDPASARFWDKAALAEELRAAVEFQRRHGVRVMCGEFGVSANAADESRQRWVADMLDVCESNGFDWSYWSYGAGDERSWSFEQSPFRRTLTERMAANQFHIQSVESGPLAARTLQIVLRPVESDRGAVHRIYVAAFVQGRWYFLASDSWQEWTGGPYPVHRVAPLPPQLVLQVLDGGIDLSGLVGAQIYVGYGLDAEEMLARGRYGLAYTVK